MEDLEDLAQDIIVVFQPIRPNITILDSKIISITTPVIPNMYQKHKDTLNLYQSINHMLNMVININ